MISNMPKMQKRKAVAPIIATLLLVAIAVVGGIIVFVWASGMFGSTAGTALPNAESLQLIGYDAREADDLTGIGQIDNVTTDTAIADDQIIVLTVRNTGVAQMLIGEVTVMGQDFVWDSGNAADDVEPDAGEFLVYSGTNTSPTADLASKSTAGIEAGEDARIAVKLDNLPSDISLGRNLQLKIKTEQGSSFNFFLVTGQSE
jgi:flagellin-like protein